MRGVIVTTLVCLLYASACGQDSPVDTFKTFLMSPPPVSRIVYKKRNFFQLDFPGAPKLDTNSYQIFSGKCQGVDFTLRTAGPVTELDNPAALTNSVIDAAGKSGSTFWKYVKDTRYDWEDKNNEFSTGYVSSEQVPIDHTILRTVLDERSMLLQVINMGVGNLKPGTLKWDGDSFTAENMDHATLRGELIIAGGFPKELHFHLDRELGESVVLFDYARAKKQSQLPDKITCEFINQKKAVIPVSEYTIISLEVASSIISPTEFSSSLFRVPGYTVAIEQLGGGKYLMKDQNGNAIIIKDKTLPPSSNRKVFIIIIIFMSATLLALLIKSVFCVESKNPKLLSGQIMSKPVKL
jgi:hypothetical protein